MVEVVVTAPVVELTEMTSKPFCERTGPEKEVFAISILYMRYRRISLHVRQPGLSDAPG
jgi:hypothetical protein